MRKVFFLILINILFFGIQSCLGQLPQKNPETGILGSWVSEDDVNYKIVFNLNGERTDYYNNIEVDKYNYSISHTCGLESDIKAWFLKTIDLEDSDERCYELYSANANNNNVLSIRDMTTGKIFIYNKIK